MTESAFGKFISAAKELQSFDLKNPNGDAFTIYWRELDGKVEVPGLKEFVKSLSSENLTDDQMAMRVMSYKWEKEALMKINAGMSEMGLETITDEEWDVIPESYKEAILGQVGVANANFFAGSKKVQKP